MSPHSDKPTLREQLDAVRPDSDDLRDVELQEAARAVAESDQWQETLARQQAFDRDVSAAMQQVEIPAGLEGRLLAALNSTAAQNDPVVAGVSTPSSRRRWLAMASLAAGLLLAVSLGWLLMPRDGVRLSLEQTRQLLPTLADGAIDTSGLPAFDHNFTVELPDAAWGRRMGLVTGPKGLNWTGDDRHDGAIFEFRVGARIHGYLFVLPTTRITDPPGSIKMSDTSIGYQPVPNTAWVDPERQLAYICYVDQGDLRVLQDLLYPHAA